MHPNENVMAGQQDTQLSLLTAPRPSRYASVSGNGSVRWYGPFAMSAVVWPRRLTAMTSAPCSTRYRTKPVSPRAAPP